MCLAVTGGVSFFADEILLTDVIWLFVQVQDLFTDLADGRMLLKLLEVISGEKLGRCLRMMTDTGMEKLPGSYCRKGYPT
jgi:hypothetical protein